jgi:hypothetical protein
MRFLITAAVALTAAFLAERLVDRFVDRTTRPQAIWAVCGGFAGIICWIGGSVAGYRYALNSGDRILAFLACSLIGGVLGLIVAKALRV